MDTPFLGPWGVSRSANLARNELVNLFPEIVETQDGKAVGAFWSAPGLDLLDTVGTGPIRGALAMSDLLYVVSGSQLWTVTTNWQNTLRGSLTTSAGPVSMIQNGTQLNVFDGQQGYLIANQAGVSTLGTDTAGTDTTNAPGANTIFLITVTPTVPMTLNSVSCVPAASNAAAKFRAVVYAGITVGSAVLGSGSEIQGAIIGNTITSTFGTPVTLAANTTYAIGFITDSAVLLAQADTGPGGSKAANTYGSGAPATLPAMTAGAPDWLIWGSASLAPFVLSTLAMPFPNPTTACYQDGFGLVSFANLQDIAQSNLRDLSIYDPLNFSTADANPDDITRLFDIHEEVFVIKQTNTEVWVNAGLSGFAFQRLTGVHIEVGSDAPFSVAKAGETLIWLGRNDQGNRIVVQALGYQVKPISTQALDAQFATYAQVSDAIGYVRQIEGHVIYVLTFPSANATWAYDLTASGMAGRPMWHRLAALGTTDPRDSGLLNRHWGNAFTLFEGAGEALSTVTNYCPNPVKITAPVKIISAGALANMGTSFARALFSIDVSLADDAVNTHGVIWTNQADVSLNTTNPGLFIEIANDQSALNQVTIQAWDAAGALIVLATYAFTSWAAWVNFLISIDTVGQQIQVYAAQVVSGILVENPLTAINESWLSANPIGNPAGKPWYLVELV